MSSVSRFNGKHMANGKVRGLGDQHNNVLNQFVFLGWSELIHAHTHTHTTHTYTPTPTHTNTTHTYGHTCSKFYARFGLMVQFKFKPSRVCIFPAVNLSGSGWKYSIAHVISVYFIDLLVCVFPFFTRHDIDDFLCHSWQSPVLLHLSVATACETCW